MPAKRGPGRPKRTKTDEFKNVLVRIRAKDISDLDRLADRRQHRSHTLVSRSDVIREAVETLLDRELRRKPAPASGGKETP